MKKILIGTVATAVSLLLVSCASTNPVPKNVVFLNDSEIKTLFNDKTASGLTSGSGKPYEIKFNSNGTFEGTISSNNISGTWFVKGNDKCMTIRNRDYCSKHYKLNGEYFTYNEDKNRIVPITIK